MASTDIEQSAKQPPASEVVTSDPKLISSQYDVANKILAETAAYENEIFTEEEDRKLRWKIDWHLIPAVSDSHHLVLGELKLIGYSWLSAPP